MTWDQTSAHRRRLVLPTSRPSALVTPTGRVPSMTESTVAKVRHMPAVTQFLCMIPEQSRCDSHDLWTGAKALRKKSDAPMQDSYNSSFLRDLLETPLGPQPLAETSALPLGLNHPVTSAFALPVGCPALNLPVVPTTSIRALRAPVIANAVVATRAL